MPNPIINSIQITTALRVLAYIAEVRPKTGFWQANVFLPHFTHWRYVKMEHSLSQIHSAVFIDLVITRTSI